MMRMHRRRAAALLMLALAVTGCSMEGDEDMRQDNSTHSTDTRIKDGATSMEDGATSSTSRNYVCTGHTFTLQPTGQRFLGENSAGESSVMVLTEIYTDDAPPAALVAPVFAGDQLMMETLEFIAGQPQNFPGVGTVTLMKVGEPETATFCFEPDAGFTVDRRFNR